MTTGRGSFLQIIRMKSDTYLEQERRDTDRSRRGQRENPRELSSSALLYAGGNKQSLTLNQGLLEKGTGDKTS